MISQPDLPSALWDAILWVKNEEATWLELTWDFEGTATLFSSHVQKGNRNLKREQFQHKQRKSHVYNAETMLKPLVHFLGPTTVFPKIISHLDTKNSNVGSFPLGCSSALLGNLTGTRKNNRARKHHELLPFASALKNVILTQVILYWRKSVKTTLMETKFSTWPWLIFPEE